MIKKVYFYRDVVAGSSEIFGSFANDAVASREFNRACTDPKVFSSDLELYHACDYDTESGKVFVGDQDPVFIMRGKKNVPDNV